MWFYQQLLYEIQPDLLIEIGSRFGGSTQYLAHTFDAIGKGRVLSIDINRTDYQARHPRIIEITKDSGSSEVLEQTRILCEGQRVMFIHDGSHACANGRCNLELD